MIEDDEKFRVVSDLTAPVVLINVVLNSDGTWTKHVHEYRMRHFRIFASALALYNYAGGVEKEGSK